MSVLIPTADNEYLLGTRAEQWANQQDQNRRTYGPLQASHFWKVKVDHLEKVLVQSLLHLTKWRQQARQAIHDDSLTASTGRGIFVLRSNELDTSGTAEVTRIDSMSSRDLQNAYQTLGLLESLKVHNTDILQKLKTQNIREDDWFVSTENVREVLDCPVPPPMKAIRSIGHESVGDLVRVRFVNGTTCSSCNSVIERSRLAFHQIHPECIIETKRKAAARRGMVKLDDFRQGLAAREAGLVTEMVPIQHEMYVEAWVKDAIDIHDKQKRAGTAFADLTLVEMLVKMKPE